MEFKAKDIAALLNGQVEGDENIIVNNVCKIEDGKTGCLAFLANPKYEHYIYETKASVVLVNEDFKATQVLPCTLIRVKSAYESIAVLLNMYESMKPKPQGIESPSFIDESAKLGSHIYIGAFAYIGKNTIVGDKTSVYPQTFIGSNVKIGNNVTIHAGVKIYDNCIIGDNCIIHSGVVIGADGFGFAPHGDTYQKIAQIGNVIVEDNVEIGANTCIDRATMGSTIIRKGVKLDNLIQVAHNVIIDENTVIAAQSGIAGSTKIGKHCVIGGQVGFIGHLTIGDGVQFAAQSGITSNVKSFSTHRGSPSLDFNKYQKCAAIFRKLPELYGDLNELKKEINILKSKLCQ